MDNLDAFLLQTKIDLDSAKEQLERKDHLDPQRFIYWTEFLLPLGIEMNRSIFAKLNHIYIPDTDETVDYNTAVIHGHKESSYCAAPKMCHMYSFWPTVEMSPRFTKIFVARWKPVYGVLKWKVPK